ncbi:MAG: glycosyltransferase family 9 protein [Verrucomicrobiales bacterium]|nr:glycosyltransferase family 9 protein [Verrucomicrobiales bacterium]
MAKHVNLQFRHGLGDCVYFAHQLPLYTKRGWHFRIQCSSEREFVFRGIDNVTVESGDSYPKHPWVPAARIGETEPEYLYLANKPAGNISQPPMPDIGLIDRDLWNEYCGVSLNLTRFVPPGEHSMIVGRLRLLPGPVILLHSFGTSLKKSKNISWAGVLRICRQVVAKTGGSIVILNRSHRIPPINIPNVYFLQTLFPRLLTLRQLIALYGQSDLLIGIDSGPAHLARCTGLPVVMVWKNHHPAAYSLPRDNNIHLVSNRYSTLINRHCRHLYNLIEFDQPVVSPGSISRTVERYFAGCRFFKGQPGRDLQFQSLLLDRNQSRGMTIFCEHLTEKSRFSLIETGTMRPAELWSKQQCSTLLFALLASQTGSMVYSVDIDPAKCRAAMINLRYYRQHISLVHSGSLAFLKNFPKKVDALFLDCIPCKERDTALHCLEEVKLGNRLLNPGGLIAINGSKEGGIAGENTTAKAAAWLLANHFQLIYNDELKLFRKSQNK